ncbi:MAG TPA: hypothetical protein VKU01_30515 [Bryobacteraceae bacterium]|nr:hypothetical protein [Bryobacteraceae bacterium]
MRRLTCIALFLVTAASSAVVLDRIAVIVGKHVVKESDIERDIRLTDFLNNTPLTITPQAKHDAAERLIDQESIRQEIATGDYQRASDTDTSTLESQLVKDRFGGSEARLHAALTRYGLTPEQLHERLLWQLTVLRFIDQRFRVGVFVSDDEVRTYYDQHKAEFQRKNPKATYESLEKGIRDSLEGQRVNENFEQWLKQARNRNRVEYKQEAFQ